MESDSVTVTNDFVDDLNSKNDTICRVDTTVKKERSDDTDAYDISYEYSYINRLGEIKTAEEILSPHPFAGVKDSDLQELRYGYIVVKNKMTQEMVKLLLMKDDKLKKLIGNKTPQSYKQNIMLSLALLWD